MIVFVFSGYVYYWFFCLWDFFIWGKFGYFDFWKGIVRGGNFEKIYVVFSMFLVYIEDFFLLKYDIKILYWLVKRILIFLFIFVFNKVIKKLIIECKVLL